MSCELPFPLMGEPLALDLVNTRVLQDGQFVDLLETPKALACWLQAEHPRLAWAKVPSEDDLAAVRALRDVIDALLGAFAAGATPAPDDLTTLNRALAQPGARARLHWTPEGPRAVTTTGNGCAALLHALALDAVQLLVGPDAGRIRECAHPACRLRFVARNARRKWCSAATCGNRARVSRHYARQHAGA